MAKDHYKICNSCNTAHIIHGGFRDKYPTCWKCGGTSFTDSKDTKYSKEDLHIFCDWNLQHSVEETAEGIATLIHGRYKSEGLPDGLLADLIQFLIFAANNSRGSFARARDFYSG